MTDPVWQEWTATAADGRQVTIETHAERQAVLNITSYLGSGAVGNSIFALVDDLVVGEFGGDGFAEWGISNSGQTIEDFKFRIVGPTGLVEAVANRYTDDPAGELGARIRNLVDVMAARAEQNRLCVSAALALA